MADNEVTKKEQVAEALFNLPPNMLSNNMIKWIMSHLPDTNQKGENSERAITPSDLSFDHKCKEFEGTFGLKYEDLKVIFDKIESGMVNSPDADETLVNQKSIVLEKVYDKFTDREKAFLISFGIGDFMRYRMHREMEKGGGKPFLDALKGIIDKLRGMQGDGQ